MDRGGCNEQRERNCDLIQSDQNEGASRSKGYTVERRGSLLWVERREASAGRCTLSVKKGVKEG